MIDLDMDLPGERKILAGLIGEHLGKRINKNSLSMALTGYRSTESSQEILKAAQEVLNSKRETIHNTELNASGNQVAG